MADSDTHKDPRMNAAAGDDGANGDDDAMLDPDEVDETVEDDGDAAMDSDNEREDQSMEEIQLQNDSVAHFDQHKDSIFAIAQHPTNPSLIATGGGDDMAYIWDSTPPEGPVLPVSYEADPRPRPREGQQIIAQLEGQDESVNAICFTLPDGEFVATGTLAGKLSIYTSPSPSNATARVVATAKEVEEINWLLPCPSAQHPNTIAFGAQDGSVWVYTVTSDPSSPLQIVQTFFLHQASCTAGAWTPDGKLLATVAEDSSLYVYDVFGEAATAGIADPHGGQAIVSFTCDDERFKVEGGLYSAAISPGGGMVAVGGAGGNIRVIGLPRLSTPQNKSGTPAAGTGAKGKAGGAKHAASPATSAGQSGQILASLQVQTDGVETLDFAQPPLTLLAAGSVDGSIALFDVAHNFAVRRHIREAVEDEQAVVQVEFVKTKLGTANDRGHVLTSGGFDGVIRRWDVRLGTAAAGQGLIGEWRGHRGGGEGGGIMSFVQGGGGKRIITAGDDGISLVFATD